MRAWLTLLLATAALADYPTPEEAGFHHCALIYDRVERSAADLAPYVAEWVDGQPRGWLFDAYLFLIQRTPSGRATMSGQTVLEDWRYQLDRWFTPARDLAALEEAIGKAAAVLGPAPQKRRVILSIPRPGRLVTDFGDVDGDGVSEDLSSDIGVRKVLGWYLDEARARFAAAGYERLELWGFYWMHEAVPPADQPFVRAASELVHAAGLKLLWIPWFRATGWDRWRSDGFDVALMQPNYAFFSQHRGRIRRNRLAVNATLAREGGLGVEIELPMSANDPATTSYFGRYLAEGSARRLGYQEGATAYYLGTDNLGLLANSDRAWQRDLYRRLAAYVRGEAVPDPDPKPTWGVDGRSQAELSDGTLTGGLPVTVAEARLTEPRRIAAVDVYLDEPDPQESWRGRVVIEAREPGKAGWRPVGWALRAGRNTSVGRWQVVTVPASLTAAAVRVRAETAEGSPSPAIAEIGLDTAVVPDRRAEHLALGGPYRFEPSPSAQYGDDGRELTDGRIASAGFASGQTVGWFGARVAVAFDLGEPVDLQRVEVYTEGGGYAAVNWPARAVLLLAEAEAPPAALAARGAPPEGFAWLLPEGLTIDRKHNERYAIGHLTFAPRRPVRARYVTLLLDASGWLMLSEVRIIAGGENVASGAAYSVRPAPTAPGREGYPDDGLRLTDGVIAQGFSRVTLSGWSDDDPRMVTVDLGSEQALNEVVVWSLGGGLYGIFAPAKVSAEVSEDGRLWERVGRAAKDADRVEDGRRCEPVAYRVAGLGGRRARWVRVIVVRDRVWSMLSEVVVR